MTRMYIDDERFPKGEFNVICRSSAEAIEWIIIHGIPEYISFDHDLGADDTAMEVIDFMIESDMDGFPSIPENFEFNVHSANPVGRENIYGKLQGYLDFRRGHG